jgi:hypothetical protein
MSDAVPESAMGSKEDENGHTAPAMRPSASAVKAERNEAAREGVTRIDLAAKTRPELKRSQTFTDRLKEGAKQAQDAWKIAEPYMEKMRPYLKQLQPVFESIWALAMVIFNIIQVFLPYVSAEVAQGSFAFVLLFFGGQFAMSIACMQAFRTCGYESMVASLVSLRDGYREAKQALNSDPDSKKLFDIAKHEEIHFWAVTTGLWEAFVSEDPKKREVNFERMYVLMRCVDPNKILDAVKGLWVGVVAVLSTLRSRMVYCVSIGANIGGNISKTLEYYVEGRVQGMFPNHKQWVTCGLRIFCGVTGIVVSLVMSRVVSAFCSALQGATILTKILHRRVAQHKKNAEGCCGSPRAMDNLMFGSPKIEELINSPKASKYETIFIWVVSLFGFAVQLITKFDLPLWCKIPLAPLYLVESLLSVFAVTY